MSDQNLPEVRLSDYLNSIGVFDPDTGGFIYNEQIGYFDETRLDSNDRCVSIIATGENTTNGDEFEDINISLFIVGKKSNNDSVEVNLFARKIQGLIVSNTSFNDIFGIINNGLSPMVISESGRPTYILNIRMQSNYCQV